jgi:hypothetical protein
VIVSPARGEARCRVAQLPQLVIVGCAACRASSDRPPEPEPENPFLRPRPAATNAIAAANCRRACTQPPPEPSTRPLARQARPRIRRPPRPRAAQAHLPCATRAADETHNLQALALIPPSPVQPPPARHRRAPHPAPHSATRSAASRAPRQPRARAGRAHGPGRVRPACAGGRRQAVPEAQAEGGPGDMEGAPGGAPLLLLFLLLMTKALHCPPRPASRPDAAADPGRGADQR